jgi:hypothetical protein
VTNFFSDDEDADTGAASGSEQVPLVAARLKRKAAAEPEVGKKKSKNKKEKGGKNDAVNGKSDKGGKGDKSAAPSADDAAAVEKRAKVAAELLKTRCELPFYQGTSSCPQLSKLGT